MLSSIRQKRRQKELVFLVQRKKAFVIVHDVLADALQWDRLCLHGLITHESIPMQETDI